MSNKTFEYLDQYVGGKTQLVPRPLLLLVETGWAGPTGPKLFPLVSGVTDSLALALFS